MLMLSDRLEESEVLAREAIAMAQMVPDGRSVEGHARCNLGVDLAYTGRLEEGLAQLREAHRIAEEQFDDVDDIARALVNLQSVLYDHGRFEEAAEVALENVRVTEMLGLQRRKGVWSRCDAIDVLLALGRFDEAALQVDEAWQLQPQGIDAFRTHLEEGHLWFRRGDLDRARTALEQAEAAGPRIIDPHLLCPLYVHLVEVAVEVADHEAAARWSADGLRRLAEVQYAAHHAPLLAAAATAAVRAGRPDEARPLLDRAAELVAGNEVPGTPAEIEVLAAEAELAGDAAAWQEVAEAWEGMGEPFRAAYAHLRAAEQLIGTDRDEAAEHLRAALETARRIGADGLAQRAEDVGRRSRLRVEAEPGNPYGVTSREAEVLRLVAEGLTDRAIGGRLYISHRTVERHVSNLLAKLAAGRRSELVATAHRVGLLGDDAPGEGQ
jgi:ATP/maltotriose-dependent transcriptional regulator MalT